MTALREAAIAGAQLQNFVPEVREHLQKVGGLIRTPGDGPIMACFSSEMRTFLTEQREATPEPPAPIAGLDPTTAGDDGVSRLAATCLCVAGGSAARSDSASVRCRR